MHISIVIVSYNSLPFLQKCLDSIFRNTPNISCEIIIVDNASSDDSVAFVRDLYSNVRLVVNQTNMGFAAAVNQGLALTKGTYVVLLNPDAELLPVALERMIMFLEAHPRAAAVGPRQWIDSDCTWQGSIVPSPPHWRLLLSRLPGLRRLNLARRQLVKHWKLNRTIWRNEEPVATPYLSGACLLLRRTTLEAVGGLDEGYFLFYEDLDLCDRLRSAGWELYAVPSAGVVHTGLGSVRSLQDGGARYLLNSGGHYLAQHGDPSTRALWSLLQLRNAFRVGTTTIHTHHSNLSESMTLKFQWPSIQNATAYWVEIAAEPLFLYTIATEVKEQICVIPKELTKLSQIKHIFWRIAAVKKGGQLGSFTEECYERIPRRI